LEIINPSSVGVVLDDGSVVEISPRDGYVRLSSDEKLSLTPVATNSIEVRTEPRLRVRELIDGTEIPSEQRAAAKDAVRALEKLAMAIGHDSETTKRKDDRVRVAGQLRAMLECIELVL
jgi:hypothetical protein